MKVYISGPMTGHPDYNFAAFREAAAALRARGYDVVSPHELDEAASIEPNPTGDGPTPEEYAGFLARDIEVMAREGVEAVVVLPGWQESGGAKTEVTFARALKLPILRYPDLVEVPESPIACPGCGETGGESDVVCACIRERELRVINPETGGAKGRKPERYELIPYEALAEVARVYAFGAAKYDDHNWRKGYNWSLSFGAAMRHLTAFWSGEDFDPESGLPHLAHAGFHVLALLTFMREHRQLDDRPSTVLGGGELEDGQR